jgi:hypothetical protein
MFKKLKRSVEASVAVESEDGNELMDCASCRATNSAAAAYVDVEVDRLDPANWSYLLDNGTTGTLAERGPAQLSGTDCDLGRL